MIRFNMNLQRFIPSFFLRFPSTIRLAQELRRRAREREQDQQVVFDESRLPVGCRLRNHCGAPGEELSCPRK